MVDQGKSEQSSSCIRVTFKIIISIVLCISIVFAIVNLIRDCEREEEDQELLIIVLFIFNIICLIAALLSVFMEGRCSILIVIVSEVIITIIKKTHLIVEDEWTDIADFYLKITYLSLMLIYVVILFF